MTEQMINPATCRHHVNAVGTLKNIIELDLCRRCTQEDYPNCPYNKYEPISKERENDSK